MCEELIDATLQHIERLLADSQEPLRYLNHLITKKKCSEIRIYNVLVFNDLVLSFSYLK